ncbi:MAG: hypothetical protein HC822_26930 [Oscillochloris sp.]|nr:hypothetical protein [Oscillochloris sp.]
MARFEVIVATPNSPPPPGPWQPSLATPASFSTRGDQLAGATIWRADLDADVAAAHAELAAAGDALRNQELALEQGLGRMQAVLSGSASFSTAARTPERELQLLLYRSPQSAGASFSTSSASDSGADWKAAGERFQAFIAQIQDTIGNYAVVETRQQQRLIGRSSAGWSGDLRTLVISDLTPEQRELHLRTLGLALRSRAALLRTFAMITRGAAIVATAISSPAGPLLAMPAAWKFVDELLREQR